MASSSTPWVPPVPALYVGDLAADVRNPDLFDHFATVGPVGSVHVCYDFATGRSHGYGYVNYVSIADANAALILLNHTLLHGKAIRVMWSRRDPDARNNGIGNLFVKNLSRSIDNARLHHEFARFGNVLSCKVATDEAGVSKGYGFVQFDVQESANSAINELNGSVLEGKILYVTHFVSKKDRQVWSPEAKFTNLYMKNLEQDITEARIEFMFSEFGKISSVYVARDDEGNSKGFAFVNFESYESAKWAVDKMNGFCFGSKNLFVARAQKKAEREQKLRQIYEEKRNEQIKNSMGRNVFIKNIDDSVDDNSLLQHFLQCGNISSGKVMRDDKGNSKGFGFVCYTTSEEANKAVNSLHGSMFYGKPLYVGIAQRKEDRQAHLQSIFARRAEGLASTPLMPAGYAPVYYAPSPIVSQGQSVVYPPFGIRPQWRSNGYASSSSRPTFVPVALSPMVSTPRLTRQNWDHRNGHSQSQNRQSIVYLPPLQQPSHSRYIPNTGSAAIPSTSFTKKSGTLSSILAAATPRQQKQMLGEQLYPLVKNIQDDLAAKITGMLLEMDNSEVLLLLESTELLIAKVEEAVHVLEMSKAKDEGREYQF